MPERYLLDTDLLIAAFRGNPKAVIFMTRLTEDQLVCSTVTYIEVAAGEFRRDPRRDHTLREMFQGFTLAPLSEEIAKRAGREVARIGAAVEKLRSGDLAIGATALVERRTLVTRNVKHFALIPGLKIEDWSK
jgi:predicted nucleic acid-binding protein